MFAIGLLITAAVVGAIGVLVGAVQAVLLGLVPQRPAIQPRRSNRRRCRRHTRPVSGYVVAYSLLPQHSVHTEFGAATVPNISEEVLIPALWAFGVLGSLVGSAVAAWSQKT